MIIDHKIVRNSGATLAPCIHKSGPGVYAQGLKMIAYQDVFAPVLGFTMIDGSFTGYTMPVMAEPERSTDLAVALERLRILWSGDVRHGVTTTTRWDHHEQQVLPHAEAHPLLLHTLQKWWERTEGGRGRIVSVVHGDPTTENYMRYGWWLDPSTRTMPREAELDGGKLLQSYFGYAGDLPPGYRYLVRHFLYSNNLNIDLCAYYMVTHIVRLYRIQHQARAWALNLVENLDELVKELKCK